MQETWESGLIPGSGRSPGGGPCNPLSYSCLENPMDRGAWRATVHRVTENRTRLSDLEHTQTHTTCCHNDWEGQFWVLYQNVGAQEWLPPSPSFLPTLSLEMHGDSHLLVQAPPQPPRWVVLGSGRHVLRQMAWFVFPGMTPGRVLSWHRN